MPAVTESREASPQFLIQRRAGPSRKNDLNSLLHLPVLDKLEMAGNETKRNQWQPIEARQPSSRKFLLLVEWTVDTERKKDDVLLSLIEDFLPSYHSNERSAVDLCSCPCSCSCYVKWATSNKRQLVVPQNYSNHDPTTQWPVFWYKSTISNSISALKCNASWSQ